MPKRARIVLPHCARCDGLDELSCKGIGRSEPAPEAIRDHMHELAESRGVAMDDQVTVECIFTRDVETNFLPAAVRLSVGQQERILMLMSGAVHIANDQGISSNCDPCAIEDAIVMKILIRVWGVEAWFRHTSQNWALIANNKLFCKSNDPAPNDTYSISAMVEAVGMFEDRPLWIMLNGKLTWENPVEVWKGYPGRLRLTKIEFDPSKPVGFAGSTFNTFRGYATSPQPPLPDSSAAPRFLEHFRQVICSNNDVHFNFFMQLLACKLRFPTKKLRVCIVLRGEMGAGKGTVIQILRKIWGTTLMETSSINHVTGRFNSHMESLCWIVLNEAFWAGSHEGAATLKSIITEDTLAVEAKFQNIRKIRSCCDVIMTANAPWVFPGARDNRRAFILDVKRPQEQGYFERLHEAMNDEREAKEFMWYLQNHVQIPENFDPNRIIQTEMAPTEAAVDQLFQGRPGLILQWFREKLMDERWILAGGVTFVQKDKETKIKSEDLLCAFKQELRQQSDLARHGKNDDLKFDFTGALTAHRLTKNLNAIFGQNAIRRSRGDYQIPKRDDLRTHFARVALGSPSFSWEEPI